MSERYGPQHLDAWRRDGGVLIENFFTPEEVAAVHADFVQVYGRGGGDHTPMIKKKPGDVGRFNPAQFLGTRAVPLDCSPALNLIGVHPAVVDFARKALGTQKVHVYQCQAWGKFTGEADYEQPFHCDYANHTLTAPAEEERPTSITILCYFTDVTEAHGPMHYVTRPDSNTVAGPEATLWRDEAHVALQRALTPHERSSAGPAGSIFPYSIDVFHRATNMTAPNGARFAVMSCFKAAGDEGIGFWAWANHHTQPWDRIFNHATPAQLECFGVQPPGHPFWTPVTLARAQARYPGWDMTPWREAMLVAA